MPESGRSELYFIGAMMILIMVVSVAAVVFFVKTYRKEMREKEARLAAKRESPNISPTDQEVSQ